MLQPIVDAIAAAALDVLARLTLDAPFDECYYHFSEERRDELEAQFIEAFKAVLTRPRLYSIQQDIEEERIKFYSGELL